jgi:hypothetical protein
MILMLVAAGLFSRARIGQGDLPGAEYVVFPLLYHVHGESPEAFFPGSWSANFLVPSYLLSVIITSIRGHASPLAISGSSLFFYVWFPITAIVEVAADMLVPLFVYRHGYPFAPLALAVHSALTGALVLAHTAARRAGGER